LNLQANVHIVAFQFVKNSNFCKVVWRRYLGEVGKFLSYFATNLSKMLRINFY